MHHTILLKKKSHIFAHQSQFLGDIYGNFLHLYIWHCPKPFLFKIWFLVLFRFVNIGGCFVSMYLYCMHCLVPTVAEEDIDLLELKVQTIVSLYMGAEDQTEVLWKSRQ